MSIRLHLPKDWKDRATLAVRSLEMANVAGVCFWCGHQYGIGAYSAETESAPLLRCSEYPKEAKR